jgi:aconitate hydratase
MWRENEERINFTEVIELNLSEIEPSIAGPKRPQDKIDLTEVKNRFIDILKSTYEREYVSSDERDEGGWTDEGGHPAGPVAATIPEYDKPENADKELITKTKARNGLKSVTIKSGQSEYRISDGSVVIAAITSCTNTSNPTVMLGAGLVARKAVERGLKTRPWVKTSLAPGSKVVTRYLDKANLTPYLNALGFHTVGYGCTTCIGNSGPLPVHISKAITDNDLIAASVLSGNRNFEARIHPLLKMNFLASPLLVVAYALAGRIDINFYDEPLGYDPNLEPVYLRDIWPGMDEIEAVMRKALRSKDFIANYRRIFQGDKKWEMLYNETGDDYKWDEKST